MGVVKYALQRSQLFQTIVIFSPKNIYLVGTHWNCQFI